MRISLYLIIFLAVLNLRILKHQTGPEPLRRIIHALVDPTCLSQSDLVDLSNGAVCANSPEDHKQRHVSRIYYMKPDSNFPTNTRGFLYFVPAPHPSVQLASEVRFRIARDYVPSSTFATGSDLLLPDYTPWRIPLVTLARAQNHSVLRHLLLRDGLITT